MDDRNNDDQNPVGFDSSLIQVSANNVSHGSMDKSVYHPATSISYGDTTPGLPASLQGVESRTAHLPSSPFVHTIFVNSETQAGAIMQDNGSVEAGTGFPEPRSADIPNFTLPGSETVLSCQLCRWQSFSPDELLLHMQEYHHIDTEHVVSRQAKTGTSAQAFQSSVDSNSISESVSSSNRQDTPTADRSNRSANTTEVEHLLSIMKSNLECAPAGPNSEMTFTCQLCKSSFKKKKTAEAHLWIEHIRTEWAEACGDENIDDVYLQFLETEFSKHDHEHEKYDASSRKDEEISKDRLEGHRKKLTVLSPANTTTDANSSLEARASKFMCPENSEFVCTVCKIRATKAHRLIGHIIAVHFGCDETGAQRKHDSGEQENVFVQEVEEEKRTYGQRRRILRQSKSPLKVNYYVDANGRVRKKMGRPFSKNLNQALESKLVTLVQKKSPQLSQKATWQNKQKLPWQVQGSKVAQQIRSNYYVDPTGKVRRKWGRPFTKNLNSKENRLCPTEIPDESRGVDRIPSQAGRYRFFKCKHCSVLFSKKKYLIAHSCRTLMETGETCVDPSISEENYSRASVSTCTDAILKKYQYPKRLPFGLDSRSLKRGERRLPKRKNVVEDGHKAAVEDDRKTAVEEERKTAVEDIETTASLNAPSPDAREVLAKHSGKQEKKARVRPRPKKRVVGNGRAAKPKSERLLSVAKKKVASSTLDANIEVFIDPYASATAEYECKLCSEKVFGKPLLKYHLVSVHYAELKSTGSDKNCFDVVESMISELGKEVEAAPLPRRQGSQGAQRNSKAKRQVGSHRHVNKNGTESRPLPLRKCYVKLEKLKWNGPLPTCLLSAALDLCDKISPKAFRCRNCNEKFKTHSDCFSHAKVVHYGERRNQCHVCTKYFTDQAFQNHILRCRRTT